jgi:O-antigen ligase
LLTADLGSLGDRFTAKAANFEATKQDDRAPLRRATWALATEGGWAGRVWVGYGAGSFRWISPPYQAQQKELQKDGRLYFRAIHAHNDWLEMLADWGIVGLLPVLAALAWLGRRLVRALHPGHPETYPLAAGLILLGLHATIDLLFWFTPLMFTAAFILAALTIWTDQSSAETARDAS